MPLKVAVRVIETSLNVEALDATKLARMPTGTGPTTPTDATTTAAVPNQTFPRFEPLIWTPHLIPHDTAPGARALCADSKKSKQVG